jgi:RND family efflux transporter MFP subunit
LAQAEAALALAERNFERYRALAEKRAAAPVELELATTQRDQARGAVEQARGALAAARSLAGDARVVAPFAGRVSGRFVEVGDLVAPGRPLVAVESERGRRFVCSVPERLYHSAGLALGVPVPVRLDARDDLGAIAGRVAEVSPGPDPSTHAYTVKIDLGAAPASAGAAGRALLGVAGVQAVWIPREAVIEQGGLTLVAVRDRGGAVRTIAVSLGGAGGDGRVEVLSGLAGGESVLLGLAAAPPAGAVLEEPHG